MHSIFKKLRLGTLPKCDWVLMDVIDDKLSALDKQMQRLSDDRANIATFRRMCSERGILMLKRSELSCKFDNFPGVRLKKLD